jgi:hypothetical protein
MFNYGTRPIRNIEVEAFPRDSEGKEIRSGDVYPVKLGCPHLSPGGSLRTTSPTYVRSHDVDEARSTIEFSFIDVYGQRWSRTGPGAGQLAEI